MDFKTRFKGKTSTMDKNGVIGVVSKTSQPIAKIQDQQKASTSNNSPYLPQSYYYQKFQKNAEKVLQSESDTEYTSSTRADYPSYKFRADMQKHFNMDEYEIIAIPKQALMSEKYTMTHSYVPHSEKQPFNLYSQTGQLPQLVKNYSENNKNNKLNSPFVQAGYGALKQRQLQLMNLKRNKE